MRVRRLRMVLPLVCAVVLSGAPVSAQDPSPAPERPADRPAAPAPQPPDDPAPTDDDTLAEPPVRRSGFSVRGRVFGLAGFQSFTSSDSFEAVLDSSSGAVFGGGAGLLLGRNVFVDVSVSRFAADGTRVFIADGGEVIDLGIPAQVTVTPIDVSFGWRFAGTPSPGPTGKPRWRPVPYAGGGFGFQQYEETGDFAAANEDVSESHGSYHVLGGVELPFGRHFGAAADVLYRWVPDGLGTGGVSAYYDEDDLGGAQVRVKVLFTF